MNFGYSGRRSGKVSLKNDFTIGGQSFTAGSREAQGKYVRGDKEAMKMFRRVKNTIEQKATKTALRKSGNIVLKTARKNERPISKILARGLGTKIKYYKNTGTGVAVIGVRNVDSVRQKNSKGRLHDPRNTVHLVELGTKPHMIPLFGNKAVLVMHPGTAAKHPLSRALESTQGKVKHEYEITFKRVIDGAK